MTFLRFLVSLIPVVLLLLFLGGLMAVISEVAGFGSDSINHAFGAPEEHATPR